MKAEIRDDQAKFSPKQIKTFTPQRKKTQSLLKEERMEPSDFSCYLHDGIDDERQFYKLEQLSITGCPKITYRIIYALQQGTHNIQFLQFDNNFTEF